MATETTNTRELYLELANDSGEYTRVLRVPNPKLAYDSTTTKATIEAIIAPSFFPSRQSDSEGNTKIEPFFYDDYDKTKGLTQLKTVQIVVIKKEVTELT